jgi:hypothetical protein
MYYEAESLLFRWAEKKIVQTPSGDATTVSYSDVRCICVADICRFQPNPLDSTLFNTPTRLIMRSRGKRDTLKKLFRDSENENPSAKLPCSTRNPQYGTLPSSPIPKDSTKQGQKAKRFLYQHRSKSANIMPPSNLFTG